MRAVILFELVKATFAICLMAEFGFFGLIVVTLVIIPFTCGRFCRAGVREACFLVYLLILNADCFKVANVKLDDK